MPQDKSKCADELSASAADLKFLHRVPRVRLRNFRSKSGTRIIELLVPFGFRSSYSSVPRCITNFENRALALGDFHHDPPAYPSFEDLPAGLHDAGQIDFTRHGG